MKKIFVIGFNKAGTCSLHKLFKKLGILSTHSIDPVMGRINDYDDKLSDKKIALIENNAIACLRARGYIGDELLLKDTDINKYNYSNNLAPVSSDTLTL